MNPQPWSVTAQNLPEHAQNPIHTDAGAQAAGFPRALVAGVTTYAYLTHPVVEAWDVVWLEHGTADVVFKAPVFLHDEVRCTPEADGGDVTVSAVVDGRARVTMRAGWHDDVPPSSLPDGELLRTRHIRLEGEYGDEYGSRAGDDLDLYRHLGVVHPAVWPAFANHLVHTEVANGSWIHTRSIIRHHAPAPVGSMADLSGAVVRRFDSAAGVRAVLDVRIEVDGRVVATLEHHAIVDVTRRTTSL